ncbi:MAG: Multidrug resistance protein MdtH [Myxococcota bacterium]|nr:Multidrug resistance protein MdtH [Myxococcota bacterium]
MEQIRNLSWPFWVANIMEMIERLAYYGVRVVIPIYIAQADEPGGLHFTPQQKGEIFMWWALFQSVLPIFTGGFADRYGYKNQIVIAIILKIAGYLMMATQREYGMFFIGCMLLASGTAVFKPPVQGTFVRTLNEKNSGVGWGFFYMVVNVGGFLGPPLAHYLHGWSWAAVFYGCAVLVSLNFFWLLTYKEVDSGVDKSTGVMEVIRATAVNILNARLIVFILIMSAFWAGFTQLFDMMPNFIVDWVDSSSIAVHLPQFMLAKDQSRGPQAAQEWMINLNPALIILLVVHISWFVNKYMRRLSSIFLGIVISGIGVMVAGSSMNWITCLMGILCFSVGEMLCSPKMNEFLGVIAPPNKKALYMGYANIPHAIGWGYGAKLAGDVYGEHGEKAMLALRYLNENFQANLNPADNDHRVAAFKMLLEKSGMNAVEATLKLWHTYNPAKVWWPFAIAMFLSAGALLVFNVYAKRWEDVNA